MKKLINEEDFLYAREEAFKKTEINGNLYYYIPNPYGGKKIYAKTPGELKDKIREQTGYINSLLNFQEDVDLKEAMNIWNKYVRYASASDKKKFENLIDSLEDRIEQENSGDNPFNRLFIDCTEKELTEITDYLDSALPRVRDYFIKCMNNFIDFMEWSGIKANFAEDWKKYCHNNQTKVEMIRSQMKAEKNDSTVLRKVYLSDLRKIEHQLDYLNSLENYSDGYYVVLISLHTGMFAADIYKLRWKDVSFEDKTIGSCQCKMDDIVYAALLNLKNQSNSNSKKKSDRDFLFPAAENPKSYSKILSFYETVKRNAMLTSDISARDISLMKGKIMLDSKTGPDRVAEILSISRRGVLWERMTNMVIADDKYVNFGSNESENENNKKELMMLLQDFPDDKIQDLIKYVKFLKDL